MPPDARDDFPMTASHPSALLNSHLDDVSEYVPILPLEVLSARLNIPVQDLVKLDANENPRSFFKLEIQRP